jgi:RNA polymerase sigma-70 factor (ECF subfamily)
MGGRSKAKPATKWSLQESSRPRACLAGTPNPIKNFCKATFWQNFTSLYQLGTEEQIVRGCMAGKREFQKKLYDTYARKMFFVCYRYSKSREEAEDVLQEGFVKVFRNIHTFKFQGSFEGWVCRIMVNTAIEHIRKRKQANVFDEEGEVLNHPESESDAAGKMNEKELLKMLQLLPEGYRTVFNLYAIEGYSHKEIGELLDITEGTSKSQLSKAKNYLKGLLVKYFDTDIEIANE